MDKMSLSVLITAALAAISVGGLAYVLVYPFLSGEKKAENRKKAYQRQGTKTRFKGRNSKLSEQDKRRKQVEDTLKRLEDRNKGKEKVDMKLRLQQAGLSTSPTLFIIFSALFGLGLGFAAYVMGAPHFVAGALVFIAGIGVPRWVLKFLKGRRERKFLNEFPNTIDVIVRGVKSGLPLNDCMSMIAREAPDPVGPEFQEVVDSQRMGVPLEQGLRRMYLRVPLTEVSFLAIVLGIQAKAGGNLSEALGNLSNVLRDRKKMKAKIRAVSQEAKSGAMIIGSLPLIIVLVVNVITPDYMTILFTSTMGHILLGISVFWMSLGVLVMRKMINFDF